MQWHTKNKWVLHLEMHNVRDPSFLLYLADHWTITSQKTFIFIIHLFFHIKRPRRRLHSSEEEFAQSLSRWVDEFFLSFELFQFLILKINPFNTYFQHLFFKIRTFWLRELNNSFTPIWLAWQCYLATPPSLVWQNRTIMPAMRSVSVLFCPLYVACQ